MTYAKMNKPYDNIFLSNSSIIEENILCQLDKCDLQPEINILLQAIFSYKIRFGHPIAFII